MPHTQPPLPFPTYAPITEAEPNGNGGAVIVHIICPFCSKRHRHGIPSIDERSFDDTWGGRIAHCTTEHGDYLLHDPHNLVYPARWLGKRGVQR